MQSASFVTGRSKRENSNKNWKRKNKTREFVPDPDQDMDSDDDDDPDLLSRQRLAEALVNFISGQLQSSLLRVCLHTLRILSRDSSGLSPMVTDRALITLAGLGGIRLHLPCQQQQEITADGSDRTYCQTNQDGVQSDACAIGTHSSDQACCNGGGKKDIWEEDEEAMGEDEKMCRMEAMKVLCNVIYNSPMAQERASELRLLQGVWESVKKDISRREQGTGQFYRLRLLFLLTALRPELRLQLWQERGVSVLTKALERCLAVRWAEGYEVLSDVAGAPVSMEIAQEVIEVLKTLFNIAHKFNRQEPDEEDAAQYRHLAAVLRHCLLLSYDGEDTSEDIQRHTVNILSALPLKCLDVLLSVHADKASHKWEGVNMDCVHTLLCFMERRLDRGDKLKEKLIPVLNLLTESSRVHRETRHYLRQKILPPLRDVAVRPEQDPTVRGQLVRLMTHVDTDVKHCAAELLFVLCKENVSRFVKYTGYGNAAGLLAARGLLSGRRNSGDFQYASQYSSDSDSDTEEYREAKARINLVTGRVEAEQPDPMEGMTEEEKEEEACRLISMINRLSQNQIIQPVGMTVDERFAPLCSQMSGCTLQEDDEVEEENMDMMPEETEDKRI
uniref:synembryn-A isoform X2 n=1 Tax=Doryrhamphus excisus TaxID=161450 RepID=UPI0025ADA189|nr:synembryn-A isoform X2 [Doryrhamphus excisus]XP_057904269.1 synembryn-A isoform X2 [Doryrhamphus excisus]XP_057904270.1 synembryn-A isoform X2 [Doryrhamphus excisus]